MKPFTVTCNQCHSEDVIFDVVGDMLTIYCKRCASYATKLVANEPDPPDAEVKQRKLWDSIKIT